MVSISCQHSVTDRTMHLVSIARCNVICSASLCFMHQGCHKRLATTAVGSSIDKL